MIKHEEASFSFYTHYWNVYLEMLSVFVNEVVDINLGLIDLDWREPAVSLTFSQSGWTNIILASLFPENLFQRFHIFN